MRRSRGDGRTAQRRPVKVTTVAIGSRKHFARLKTERTLCGLTGGVEALGVSDCPRCAQILLGLTASHRP